MITLIRRPPGARASLRRRLATQLSLLLLLASCISPTISTVSGGHMHGVYTLVHSAPGRESFTATITLGTRERTTFTDGLRTVVATGSAVLQRNEGAVALTECIGQRSEHREGFPFSVVASSEAFVIACAGPAADGASFAINGGVEHDRLIASSATVQLTGARLRSPTDSTISVSALLARAR